MEENEQEPAGAAGGGFGLLSTGVVGGSSGIHNPKRRKIDSSSGGMQSTSTCPYNCPDSEIICDSHTGQKTCATCGAEVNADRFEEAELTFALEGERKHAVGR